MSDNEDGNKRASLHVPYGIPNLPGSPHSPRETASTSFTNQQEHRREGNVHRPSSLTPRLGIHSDTQPDVAEGSGLADDDVLQRVRLSALSDPGLLSIIVRSFFRACRHRHKTNTALNIHLAASLLDNEDIIRDEETDLEAEELGYRIKDVWPSSIRTESQNYEDKLTHPISTNKGKDQLMVAMFGNPDGCDVWLKRLHETHTFINECWKKRHGNRPE
ncbi:hypothetical protein GGS20DRAFT_596568 [Poronia punctata]|nr:hypothetical protein GGS20DRAFT_596568 [Poronia punctata]